MNTTNIDAELHMLKEGMFGVFGLWTGLEDSLAMMLQHILLPTNVNQKQYGFAIYFAPNGADVRLSILDASIKQLFYDEPHEKEALSTWAELLKRINRFRSVRNKIAHGTVSAPTHYGKQYARISGPMFEVEDTRNRAVQPKGMSLNQLNEGIALGARTNANALAFSLIIQASKMGIHDAPTLKQICLELEDHLTTESEELFAPNPPILPIPPPPSPA